MTMPDATAAPFSAHTRAFVLLKSRRVPDACSISSIPTRRTLAVRERSSSLGVDDSYDGRIDAADAGDR